MQGEAGRRVADDTGAVQLSGGRRRRRRVYLLVFRADGAFVEARVYEPVRVAGVGLIQSLGGVRRRIKTLKEAAEAPW